MVVKHKEAKDIRIFKEPYPVTRVFYKISFLKEQIGGVKDCLRGF